MRQHNKYLEKVYEEMDVYRQHLLGDRQLTTQQEETFEKIDVLRGWLRQGFSDVDVIKLAKSDPRLRVQDRRARELLAMAYEVFAELRSLRNADGIKMMYAEQFRSAAQLVMEKIKGVADGSDSEGDDASENIFEIIRPRSTAKDMALLVKEFRGLLKEAATIDGAYDPTRVKSDDKKKPQKIVLKRKTVIKNDQVKSDTVVEEAVYEIQ
ncbi:hypothetical protein [Salmonirosea aquatica]|uniref:Uncharacterized protein n=1 Tax=Salmonirosea aquatica TaxID=2654236 RepID=A0A7C9FFD4_9BACT|nr:hypothetical protein [Cytophagaceae bacterium SJW1-29]